MSHWISREDSPSVDRDHDETSPVQCGQADNPTVQDNLEDNLPRRGNIEASLQHQRNLQGSTSRQKYSIAWWISGEDSPLPQYNRENKPSRQTHREENTRTT